MTDADIAEMKADIKELLKGQARMETIAVTVQGHTKTLYGDDGRDGLVGDMTGLKKESSIVKGLLVYLGLPVAAGVALLLLRLYVFKG